ncbi:unnamed protein product [Acanthosepion pharaonis]|uniref:Uncharacterized protein n=1 Tax=Acanthosepion pharaonis TaxID=158019 RepID=A0A812EG61_ACAPH|nr:unnamed protein product [Sepia pharaonis]
MSCAPLNSKTIRHPFTSYLPFALICPVRRNSQNHPTSVHCLLSSFRFRYVPCALNFKPSDIRSQLYLPFCFRCPVLNSQTIRHPFTSYLPLLSICPVCLKFPNHPTSVHTSFLSSFAFDVLCALNSPKTIRHPFTQAIFLFFSMSCAPLNLKNHPTSVHKLSSFRLICPVTLNS